MSDKGEIHGRENEVTDPTGAVLAALLYLQVKHFICDYPLQTGYQLLNKGTYGHPGGLIHAGIHVLFTIPVFLILTPPLAIGVGILVGEFVLHYNIDWTKQQIMARTGWQSGDREFWWGIGVDQLAHNVCYIAVAAILWKTSTAS
jgi:hypothetical protein